MLLKFKPLAVAVASIMIAMVQVNAAQKESATAHEGKVSESNKTALGGSAQAKGSEVTQATTSNIQTTPPPASLMMPAEPVDKRAQGSSRFGSWRQWGGSKEPRKNRWHLGVDISKSHGTKLFAAGSGTVKSTINGGGGVNTFSVQRDNGDVYSYLHMQSKIVDRGAKVGPGNHVGTMGDRGTGPVHLHLEYYVPCQSGRVRFTGFYGGSSDRSRPGRPKYSVEKVLKSSGSQHGVLDGFGIQATGRLCSTDPTPYLPNDRTFQQGGVIAAEGPLTDYLGNSMRSQYNALYNPTPNLPLGPGARPARKKFPNMPVYNDKLTPEEIAALRSGGIDAAMYGSAAGYDLDGQLMSYQMLMSFIPSSDGGEWGTLPQPSRPVDITEMTPKEVVASVAERRFGNAAWEAAIVDLSSKALLTEYLLMTTEENFLKQQNSILKSRVEGLLAGLTQAELFPFDKKIDALQIAATAESVPSVLDVKMEPLYGAGYGAVDTSGLSVAESKKWEAVNKNDLNELLDYLAVAVTHGESSSYDAFNYGSSPCKGFSTTPLARAEDDRLGRKYVTQSTIDEINKGYKPKNTRGCGTRRYTAGRYQFTPDPFSEYRTFVGSEYAKRLWVPFEQDRTARWRILLSVRKNLSSFVLNGKGTLHDAAMDIHNEWRSVGKPIKGVPPHLWTETTHTNSVNTTSNIMVVQTLQAIQDWHKRFGHQLKGEITVDKVTHKLIIPGLPKVYPNTTTQPQGDSSANTGANKTPDANTGADKASDASKGGAVAKLNEGANKGK